MCGPPLGIQASTAGESPTASSVAARGEALPWSGEDRGCRNTGRSLFTPFTSRSGGAAVAVGTTTPAAMRVAGTGRLARPHSFTLVTKRLGLAFAC